MKRKTTGKGSRQELLQELALLRERLEATEQKLLKAPSRSAHSALKKQLGALAAEQRQRRGQLARIASELILAEQRERRRLAQILHDHLQQVLVGAKFRAELLARRVGDQQRGIAEDIGGLLHESMLACRVLAEELAPPILDEAGLAACLQWLVQWMREKRGLAVTLRVGAGVATSREDIKVFLFQAIQELLFNVLTHAGVTAARLAISRQGRAGIKVIVSDQGSGFDPETIWGRTGPDSGRFGLVHIRERLTLLGGRLQIDSTIGKGSRFTLVVPAEDRPLRLARSFARQRQEEMPGSGRAVGCAPDVAAVGKKRILLVDDHPAMRRLIASALDEEADLMIIGEAADGREALEKARELRPDLVLMDFSMPGMDGTKATRLIHAEFPEVRIIGLSVDEEEHCAARMLEAGASAYVNKCRMFDALLAAIRNP